MIVKIPAINAMGKTDGCEKAPDAILEEMKEFFTAENGKVLKPEIKEVTVVRDDIEATNENIYQEAKKSFGVGKTLFLGGDHSISYPLVKAFFESHSDAGLLILDAHADCMHNFTPPTHEDWLVTAIEEGVLKPENVLIVGLRNMHEIEIKYLKDKKIDSFSCKELFEDGLQEATQAIMQNIRKWKNLYLSLDIDIVDPAFAPSVSYPEPGGLTSRELIHIIQKILLIGNLRAADLVEVNPTKDDHKLTTKLGAKLAMEVLS